MTSPGDGVERGRDRFSPGWWTRLDLWQRRAIKTIGAILALVCLASVVYYYILITFEGESPSLDHTTQVIIEIFTGTGFGSDSPWDSPVANTFISMLDLSTFLLLFIVVPYVFRPILEDAMSPTVPTEIDRSGHVIVCDRTHQDERLIDEFEARDVDYVVISPEESSALALQNQDISVIQGDPTTVETLQRACIDSARAVVVDTEDRRSASVVLSVRELNERVRTVVLVEDFEYESHLQYAGADRVLTPRQLLGRRIAERVIAETNPARTDTISLGEDVAMLELSVTEQSTLCGDRIADVQAEIGDTVTVSGLWNEGIFTKDPPPETTVDETTVLLVTGKQQALQEMEAEMSHEQERRPNVVVAGHGMVGSTVTRELSRFATDRTVVDINSGEAIDVVGDATRESTLTEAGIENATTYVVTIADDDEAILSILAATELATDLDVIVRINDAENERKVRRAGAKYVLSLPEISGRILAEEVLHENVLAPNRQLKIVQFDATPYAGSQLGETAIAETNCLVIAVERDAELITEVPSTFEIHDGDQFVVIGNDEEIDDIVF